MKEPERIYWSPLPKEEVARKISAQRAKWYSKGVRGSCRGEEIVLCYEERFSFERHRTAPNGAFYGVLAERDGGTVITGRFRTFKFREVLLRCAMIAVVWTLFCFFGGLISWIHTGSVKTPISPILLWGIAMILCLIGLVFAYFMRERDVGTEGM